MAKKNSIEVNSTALIDVLVLREDRIEDKKLKMEINNPRCLPKGLKEGKLSCSISWKWMTDNFWHICSLEWILQEILIHKYRIMEIWKKNIYNKCNFLISRKNFKSEKWFNFQIKLTESRYNL